MSNAFLSRFFPVVCRTVVLICPLLVSGCGGEDDFFQRRETAKFAGLVDEYFDGYFAANPVVATEMGIHEFDDMIGPVDRDQIFGERRRLQDTLQALKRIEAKFLSQEDKFDYQILDYHVQSSLVDTDMIGYWARDPGYYDELICRGIDALLHSSFAPLETRLKSIIAREQQVPAVLEGARDIIETVPRVLARIAVDQFESTLTYFRDYLPRALEGVEDPALLDEFQVANDAVIAAYEDYLKFLNEEVLGDPDYRFLDFYLGRKNFEDKLLYQEALEMSFNDMLEYGQIELEGSRDAMVQAAKEIDPDKEVQEILREMSREGPATGELFVAFEEAIVNARQFVSDRGLLAVFPTGEGPRPREMASFLWPSFLVSLDVPGLMEPDGIDAYVQLSVPSSGSNPSQVTEHMGSYNSAALTLMAAHQGFPGLYVHAVRRRESPTRIRQILQAPSFQEGWALYAEGMMVEEGYSNDDPRVQLERWRRRAASTARLVAGLNIHTLKMSFQEAVEFVMEEAYLDRPAAEREVRLAVRKPLSVASVLSQRVIVQLKTDALAQGVTLRDFHEGLLADGLPPGIRSLRTWSRPELRPPRTPASSSR